MEKKFYPYIEDDNFKDKHYDVNYALRTKENFNNLSEYTNEEKKKILATFASKHGLSEQEALLDINKGLNEDKQGTIDNLNECF